MEEIGHHCGEFWQRRAKAAVLPELVIWCTELAAPGNEKKLDDGGVQESREYIIKRRKE